MSYYLDADYTQTFLLPPALEQWVPDDHPVRFIREFVDNLAAGELGFEPSSETGRPAYSPALLMKIWLYAYSQRLTSSRKVEQACKELAPMIWLCGMLEPDHNTLNRFWTEHRKQIKSLFKSSVNVASNLGLVGFALHAIDGTKIQAAGSTHRVFTKAQLEKLEKTLEAGIERLEKEIEESMNTPSMDPVRLSSQLQDRKNLRAAVIKALAERKDDDGTARRHLTETDARMVKGVGLGYNAQAVTDGDHNIIVAEAVVNDTNDTAQLIPMMDLVVEEYGRLADETVADGGYNTAASIAAADEKGYSILLSPSSHDPERNDGEFHTSKFTYDVERDVVTCPQKQELPFYRETKRKRSAYPVRIYKTSACKACPVREHCVKDSSSRDRRIELHPDHAAVVRQREKRGSPGSAAKLARRMPVAERVFAVIKSILGIRRFRRSGQDNASVEWSFVCALHNLMRIWSLMALQTA